jgi:hypothetical protein
LISLLPDCFLEKTAGKPLQWYWYLHIKEKLYTTKQKELCSKGRAKAAKAKKITKKRRTVLKALLFYVVELKLQRKILLSGDERKDTTRLFDENN